MNVDVENMVKVEPTTSRQGKTDNRQLRDRQVEIYCRKSAHTHTHTILAVNRWWVVLPKTGLLDTLRAGWCVRARTRIEHKFE